MNSKNFRAVVEAHYFHYCVRIEEHEIDLASPKRGLKKTVEALNTLMNSEMSLHAFVFMGDHFHALIDLNGEYGFSYPNPISQVWKPLLSYAAYLETYRYIYRNPIEEKLVVDPEKYPFSSLSWILGRHENPGLVIVDRLNVIQNPFKVLRWIRGGHSPFHIPQERYLW